VTINVSRKRLGLLLKWW